MGFDAKQCPSEIVKFFHRAFFLLDFDKAMQPVMTCAASSRSRETADFLLMRGIVSGLDFGNIFVLLMVT